MLGCPRTIPCLCPAAAISCMQEVLRGKQEVMNQLSDCFSVITQVMSEYGMVHSAEWALVGQQMELGRSQSGSPRDSAFSLPGHVVSYIRAIHDPQLAQQVRAGMACRTFKSGLSNSPSSCQPCVRHVLPATAPSASVRLPWQPSGVLLSRCSDVQSLGITIHGQYRTDQNVLRT